MILHSLSELETFSHEETKDNSLLAGRLLRVVTKIPQPERK